MVKSRCIVGSIACNGHHFATLLQQVNQSLFIRGTSTRHHAEHFHAFVGCVIAQFGKVGTRNLRLQWCLFLPDTNLSGNLDSRCSGVARYDFHLDTSVKTLFNGSGNIFSNRVADGSQGLKGEALHQVGFAKAFSFVVV